MLIFLRRFRFVACMLREIEDCLGPKELAVTLSQLPQDLNALYDRILSRYGTYHSAIHRALQWICLSNRTLTIEELNDAALAIDTSTPTWRFDPALRTRNKLLLTKQLSSLVRVESFKYGSVSECFLSSLRCRLTNLSFSWFI